MKLWMISKKVYFNEIYFLVQNEINFSKPKVNPMITKFGTGKRRKKRG